MQTWRHVMLSNRLRDLAGFAFFSFAAVVSGAAACEHSSLLIWLYAFHNLLLAWFYTGVCGRALRPLRFVVGDDCSFVPVIPYNQAAPWYLLMPGLAGYGLCLGALTTFGPRFGNCSGDRGLTARGPYRFLRHPMYLGE